MSVFFFLYFFLVHSLAQTLPTCDAWAQNCALNDNFTSWKDLPKFDCNLCPDPANLTEVVNTKAIRKNVLNLTYDEIVLLQVALACSQEQSPGKFV